MKRKSLLFLLLMALGLPWAANAQTLGDYTFSTGTDATKWKTVTSTTTYLVSGGDSQASTLLNIGFTFPFGEDTYTQFSVNTDGNLRLGSTGTGTSQYTTPFGLNYGTNNANYNNPKINAFGCDGYATANHYVKYQTFDDNLLVVEFCMGTYTSNTRNYLYKWQIQLHSNGDIEIVFPDAANLPETNPAVAHQCGMCVDSSDGWIITLSDNVATHFTSSTSTTNASGTWFDANRYYTFTRPVLTCFRPQNLQATLTPGDGSIATLTWERHLQGTENAWVLEYGTASDFSNAISETVTGTPSKDLTSLTPETTYYARVKPDCDTDGSLWSATCTFTPSDAYSITLNDQNTTTNNYIPIYGTYVDWGNRNQFIIPASALADLQWASIEKLTFYATQSSATFTNDVFSVYMTEVSSATFASNAFVDWSSLSTVYSGSVSIANNKMEIEFDTPYTYSGGNLLVGFQQTAYNTTVTCTWVGTTQTENTALYQYANSSHEWSGTVTAQKFLPKLTIEYTPGEAPACLPATNLAANDVTAHTASLSWTANNGESTWKLYWKKTSDANYTEVAAGVTNPYPLTGLDGETQYTFYVVADCGDGGESDPSLEYSFTTLVACPIPTALTVVENTVTTNSATLSWIENGTATAWQICLNGDEANLVDVDESELVDGAYTLNGLTPSTNYTVKVRANCGGIDGTSEWSNQVSLTTECEAIDLADEVYTENFDDGNAVSSYTPSVRILPICWEAINTCTYSSYKYYPVVSSYGSNSYAHSGSNYLRFYSYYSSDPQPQYAILPEMDNLAGKQITLWAKGYNGTSSFKVGTMTNPIDATTFEVIDEHVFTASDYQTYQEIIFNIPADARGNYVAIMIEAATSSRTYNGVYIDDIKIADPPTCLRPENLAFESSTTTEATLSWTNGAEGQTAWQIAYSTDPAFDPDEVTPVDVTSNPGTIDGLTAATTYYAYVRANCGNDGYSDWSISYVQFATSCYAITDFPVSYNFETSEGFPANASTPTTNQLGACWRNEATYSPSSGSYLARVWGTSTSYKHEGSQALVLPDKGNSSNPAKTMLVFPEMVFTSESGYTVSFWINRNATSTNPEGFKVYISDTDTISANAVELGHYSRNYGIAYPVIESAAGWYQYEIEIPKSMMTGNVFLIFEGQSYYGNATYVDEVVVKETPTCLPPTGLYVSAIYTTSATMTWDHESGTHAWQVCVYPTDNIPDELVYTDTNNDNSYSTTHLGTLQPATNYTFFIRKKCSDVDFSEPASIQFTTECEVITVDAANPYTQDFSTWTPVCWELGDDVSTSYSGTSNWTQSSGAAYSSYYGTIDLYMPTMYIDANNAVLQFQSKEGATSWYTGGSNDHGGLNIVKLSTDNGINWVQLWCPTIDELTTSFRTVTISLEDYVGQDIIIAFEYQGDDAHSWYIDDVMVAVPFTKTIAAYGESEKGGYYFIASPLADAVDPATVGMITDELGANATPETAKYDLYWFDQTQDLEWRNYRANTFDLVNGMGYLYASKEGTTLTFIGVPYSGNGEVSLVMDGDGTFAGWNLVGNPFSVDVYINKPFYTLENSDTYTENTTATPIHAMQGLLVEAEEDGETLTFTTEAPAGKVAKLNMNLRSNNKQLDNAILVFGGNQQLGKFTFRENSSKIYMPVEGKDYAITTAESNMGEMPVSFKAEKNGSYSLSFNAEEVTFAYLHLIDNLTGIETDLLANPSYSFEASTTDYASRFKLVFATGDNSNEDNFAFFSNGSFVINNEGNATLQVVDVTGRIIKSESINGCANVNVNAAPGVYMIRLVNGENVRVQKVVVR